MGLFDNLSPAAVESRRPLQSSGRRPLMTFLGMRLLFIIAILLVVRSASPALAFNEPDSFLGVKWGDTPDAAREVMWKRDGDVRCESGVYGQCIGETTIGDLRITIVMRFEGGHFSGATGFFQSRQYRQIRAMFVEKYGTPTKTETETVSNRLGATLTGESLHWIGKGTIIDLKQYGVKIAEGAFSLLTKAEIEAAKAREKASIKKGKGDL